MATGRTSSLLAPAIGFAALGPVGAIGGALWIRSQQHRWADPWTSQVQSPFDERVKSIIDPITAKRESGTLTLEEVNAAETALEKEIAGIEDAALQYESQGGNQELIIKQFREGMEPNFEAWRSSLAADRERLAPAMAEEDAPTMSSILAPLGQTAGGQARAAAEQQRKRSAAGGRRATILSGYQGYTAGTSEPRTLLGY